VYNKNRITNKI